MKFDFQTKEGRKKFIRTSVLGIVAVYIGYAAFLVATTDAAGSGFLLMILTILAPLQILMLSLFAYFFERGYRAALFFLGWVLADTVLMITGSELMPSYLLLEIVL